MWQDSCPAFLADKRLGRTSGLMEAWQRVQARVDAADELRVVKLDDRDLRESGENCVSFW